MRGLLKRQEESRIHTDIFLRQIFKDRREDRRGGLARGRIWEFPLRPSATGPRQVQTKLEQNSLQKFTESLSMEIMR